MQDTIEMNRLRLACRRGMLELDLFLNRYLDTGYQQADEAEKALFETLLGCEDPDLFAWLTGKDTPKDPGLHKIVSIIQRSAILSP
jgi:antitoxin CptB